MKITSLQYTDLALLPGLQPEGWQDIVPAFEYYEGSNFCFPLKVIDGDKIVGIGAAIIHHPVAWLGHIIVHNEHRKKGIGSFITRALMDSAYSKKCETICLLATELGAPVYEKAGFVTETEYLFFKDVKMGNNHTVSSTITNYKDEFKEQIAQLDRTTSGEERLFHLEDHLRNGFVFCDDGIVSGFYLPHFGDGLIIADNPGAGLELLKLHLKTKEKVVFPKDNLVAANFMFENGFKEFSTGKRMHSGKKRTVRFENIYNRIGGNLG